MQCFLGMALETQHQHRRGVGSTDQAEAVGPVDPQPSMVDTWPVLRKRALATSLSTRYAARPRRTSR
jgi:hypothetical protein